MADVLDVLVEAKPPNTTGWLDYMNKSISARLLGGVIAESVDRARIILGEVESFRIVETLETIDVIVALFFGEGHDLSTLSTQQNSPPQKIFRRGDLSEPLALCAAFKYFVPAFRASNRTSFEYDAAGKPVNAMDHYGISGELPDARQRYLGALALRDSFMAARLAMDADSYGRLDLDVDLDPDDPDNWTSACESAAAELLEEANRCSEVAGERAARAIEAVTLAEAINDLAAFQSHARIQQTEVVREAVKSDRSKSASQAASARHKGNRELKALALQLYSSGRFRSKLQAAKAILPDVQVRARAIGCPLSADRGEKTVYDWLLYETQ